MTHRFTLITAAAVAIAASGALAQEDATLSVAESGDIGEYIVGPDGKPVYMFTTDTQGNEGEAVISCTSAECLEAWPLVTTDGDPTVADGLDQDMVGTLEHDGDTVVTYNGWPLYLFVRDEPGQPPQGNHVESFGGEWYLLGPDGEKNEGGEG